MIISGKELSARLKADMAAEVATFPAKYGRVPHLAVILVGDDPAGCGSRACGREPAPGARSCDLAIRKGSISPSDP